jgi:hypothetical protein
MTESPTEVIGREEPLPTTIDEGLYEFKGRGLKLKILPAKGVVWCEAPESATQFWTEVGGGWSAGAEGASKRLLVPAWRGNKCGLLEQWLRLLLPEHESQGSVGNQRGQVGLRALLSRRNGAEVHGDVPLPRVDIRQPRRSGPVVGAGGSSGGRSGVARVTTTAATAAAIPTAAITAIAAVVVLIHVVIVVGRTGRRGNLQLGSRRCSAGVERRRSSGWPSGV